MLVSACFENYIKTTIRDTTNIQSLGEPNEKIV